MFLEFEKWQGCENDFAVVWLADSDGDVVLDSLKRQAKTLCDRHRGIGADGLLVLRTAKRESLTPHGLVIINSDGSVAKNCGNGLRCAALSVFKRHAEQGDKRAELEAVELNVEGVPMVCTFTSGKAGGWPLVVVAMGRPSLEREVAWYDEAAAAVKKVAAALQLPELGRDLGVCEIGNPHLVLQTPQASRALLLQVGPALQSAGPWDGINVHLVRPKALSAKDQSRAGQELGERLTEAYDAFVWERGAGETRACGSGACAVGALALATGLVERDGWLAVDMPGGRLYVKQSEVAEPVLLAGPGSFVFSGKVQL